MSAAAHAHAHTQPPHLLQLLLMLAGVCDAAIGQGVHGHLLLLGAPAAEGVNGGGAHIVSLVSVRCGGEGVSGRRGRWGVLCCWGEKSVSLTLSVALLQGPWPPEGAPLPVFVCMCIVCTQCVKCVCTRACCVRVCVQRCVHTHLVARSPSLQLFVELLHLAELSTQKPATF